MEWVIEEGVVTTCSWSCGLDTIHGVVCLLFKHSLRSQGGTFENG